MREKKKSRVGGWVGCGWVDERTEVGFEDVLKALGGRAVDQQGLLLGHNFRTGIHETRSGGHDASLGVCGGGGG